MRTRATASRAELNRTRTWIEQELDGRMQVLLDYAAAIAAKAQDGQLSASAVEALNPQVKEIISASSAQIGAGFIAAPGVVIAHERYMLWLQPRNGGTRRLHLNFDTSDLDAYDYVAMDWFARTRDRLQPCLTGPYLDYSGSDALVLTMSAPVLAGEHFLGVVAMDLMAQAAEDLMTAQLCALRGDAVVVNSDRAIVATNSVRWMPGERLSVMPGDEAEEYDTVLTIGTWLGWQLAVAKQR